MVSKLLFTVLTKALAMASPEICEGIRQFVQEMVERAEKTPNPWDDVFCDLLQGVVGKPGAKRQSADDGE
jgi:hypothetical protein